MLILRRISKLFSETKKRERDPLPEKFKINPEFIGKFEKNTIRVIYSDQYNDDMKELGELVKKDVRNLIKDIKKGYLYEDGPNGGDTHYLKDYSDPKKYHRMSKSVNTFDRVVYTIYPPILDAENKRLITPITINNAKNHKLPGQKEYSDREIILRNKQFSSKEEKGIMTIEDVFSIIRRGTIATGKIESGIFKVGDNVEISDENTTIQTSIKGIEIFRKIVDEAKKGENVGLLLANISEKDIKRGMIIKVI